LDHPAPVVERLPERLGLDEQDRRAGEEEGVVNGVVRRGVAVFVPDLVGVEDIPAEGFHDGRDENSFGVLLRDSGVAGAHLTDPRADLAEPVLAGRVRGTERQVAIFIAGRGTRRCPSTRRRDMRTGHYGRQAGVRLVAGGIQGRDTGRGERPPRPSRVLKQAIILQVSPCPGHGIGQLGHAALMDLPRDHRTVALHGDDLR
jgi:hypothetical protein